MKKYILLATIAVSSLHADDRNEYYNSLAKAGAAPAGKTVEKTASRDEYYASLLANMQNNSGPKVAVPNRRANLPEPSAEAIYNAYPNQEPGFYPLR